MSDSILLNVKKILGIAPEYKVFDEDIITHINSVFSTLHQLGLGPVTGFAIFGEEETWDLFLDNDPRYYAVKSYMYLRVRLLFDPPTTSYLINSMDEQRKELEWRLNVVREGDHYPAPTPLPSEVA